MKTALTKQLVTIGVVVAGLWLLELTLLVLLDGDALVAAMLAPRPSLAMLGGMALALTRVLRLVLAPMIVAFVVVRALAESVVGRASRQHPT